MEYHVAIGRLLTIVGVAVSLSQDSSFRWALWVGVLDLWESS